MEDCFKPMRVAKTYEDAYGHCRAEGAVLARPQHELDVSKKKELKIRTTKDLIEFIFLFSAI